MCRVRGFLLMLARAGSIARTVSYFCPHAAMNCVCIYTRDAYVLIVVVVDVPVIQRFGAVSAGATH